MRITRDLSAGWRFQLGDVQNGHETDLDDTAWQQVDLPHSWNATDTFTPTRGYYRGPAWYRKAFHLSEQEAASRVLLEFGAGFAVAEAWVNGHPAGSFMGGFTGFTVDASEWASAGDNLIAIRLDNTHNPDVLPGKEIPDYNLYGGLYREAALVLKDRIHIPQYAVKVTTPEVSKESAVVRIELAVRNELAEPAACICIVDLRDPSGDLLCEMRTQCMIAAGEQTTLTLESAEIDRPLLWSPDSPHLYEVDARIAGDEETNDRVVSHVGLRWFEFDGDNGFLLNGRPCRLRGVNRHQDYLGLANALPPRLQVHDAELIKEMGGNFVRASHYPQHPAFLDACDRLGILVYEEIASWQFIGGEQFVRNAAQMMREMIARDGNHPSIILWGLLNEGRSKDLFERLNETAHAMDPTRPTIYAENRPEEGKELGTVFVPDVLGINYKLPHLDEIRDALPGLKLLSSEHTNYDQAARGDLDHEIAQVRKLDVDLEIIEARPFMAGSALWSMHDYGTDYEPVWPVQHSGVLDACRLPKEGYYLLKSRWSEAPVLHLCGHWTWEDQDKGRRTVTVVHNCDSVELFLNDRPVGSRDDCAHITDFEVEYEPGMLKAVGHRQGQRIEAELRTAGPPDSVRLHADPREITADGMDVSEVTVEIVDAQGVRVPSAHGEATFTVSGPAALRGLGGTSSAAVIGGIGRIIVQATTEPGAIAVCAEYDGIRSESLALRSIEPGSTGHSGDTP